MCFGFLKSLELINDRGNSSLVIRHKHKVDFLNFQHSKFTAILTSLDLFNL